MKQNKKVQEFLSVIFSLVLIMLLAVPGNVLAQEEIPQPEPTAETPAEGAAEETQPQAAAEETPLPEPTAEALAEGAAEEIQPQASAEETPLVEEPAVEGLALEAPVVEEPAADENPVELPAVDEPVVEATVAQAVETLAAEDVVLVSDSGEEIPLASQEAAQVLSQGDPWFMANDGSGDVIGYTYLFGSCAPVVTVCIEVAYPVQAAIDDPRSTGQDITIDGNYYEQITIVNKNVNLIGASTGGGLFASGPLFYNFTSGVMDVFSLIYIENSTVNIQGLTINGSGGLVNNSGIDYYAGVTFNNASGSVIANIITGFTDADVEDEGVGIFVSNGTGVTIAQNAIIDSESETVVKNSPSTTISKVSDVDGDSVTTLDNCPRDANSGQADHDNDGHGDVCDTDDDGDGVDDLTDNCVLKYNPRQADSDDDGIGNTCDPTPFPPSLEAPVSLFEGLIPVTGGQLVQIPCDSQCVTLQLPDGSWAEFCGLCDYWASITAETGETLPYGIPDGATMLSGMTVVLMDPAQVLLNSLPAGTTLQVGFPKGGEASSGLKVDFYDVPASKWLELSAVDAANYLRAYIQTPGTSIFCK